MSVSQILPHLPALNCPFFKVSLLNLCVSFSTSFQGRRSLSNMKNSELIKFLQGETLVMAFIYISCRFHRRLIIYQIRGGKQASVWAQKQPQLCAPPSTPSLSRLSASTPSYLSSLLKDHSLLLRRRRLKKQRGTGSDELTGRRALGTSRSCARCSELTLAVMFAGRSLLSVCLFMRTDALSAGC